MKTITNKDAVALLTKRGAYESNSAMMKNVVGILIAAGFIEADEMTDAEYFAQCARSWISLEPDPRVAFNNAKGWNTDGWAVVTGEDLKLPQRRSIIFDALVILAKEAGVEL